MTYWSFVDRVNGNIPATVNNPIFPLNRDYLHWLYYEGIDLLVTIGQTLATERVTITPMANKRSTFGVEFIEFRLTQEDAPIYEAWWAKEQEHVAVNTENLLNSGYKLSFTPDFENACIIVTVIGKSCGGANEGRAFSSRSDDWLDALGMCLYKHFVLAAADEWPEGTNRRSWG
jgi:hypothetical protein